LIVYYSERAMQSLLHKPCGLNRADVEEIVDKKSRSGPVGWLSGGRDARKGAEPKLRHSKSHL
jgi:hypothetical protein